MVRKVLVLALVSLLAAPGVSAASFTLSSPDFRSGSALSVRNEANSYGCHGGNVAPRLVWSNPPAGTRSFALTVVDPDAPKAIAPTGFVHWVVYNIPATWRFINGNAPRGTTPGTNGAGMGSYLGPCPPLHDRPHHYYFTLYALSVSALTPAGLRRDALVGAVRGHVLGAAQVVGFFQRP
ncbi:MAG: Raf kinase inhibitor-like protein YbcL [Chloroflexota bacterium]